MDTWRTWELVLASLERRHDVLAPTLPGHAGGPSLGADVGLAAVVAAVESALDAAGFETAHLVGSSLGGYVAFHLAMRGRARSVVAFAPSGGWAKDDESARELLAFQRELHALVATSAGAADTIVATEDGRRRATRLLTSDFEHIPTKLLAHLIRGMATCEAEPLLDAGLREGWHVDPERVACPVRIVWGTADRLLPWPAAAARYRDEWFPHAEWIELDRVGHYPQLDVPLEAAELVMGLTG